MKKINISMLILITLLSCFMLTACFDSGSTQTDEPCEHVYRAWKTTKEVTCLENGLKERSCFLCGEKQTETILASGHKTVTLPAVLQTCTQDGLTEGEKCTVCNEILTPQEKVPAHFMILVQEKAPSCLEKGFKHYECSACDKEYTEFISETGHALVKLEAVSATCTEDGLTEGEECVACGIVTIKQNVIPAAHKPELVEGKAPTCFEAGSTNGEKCSECGITLVEQEVIEPKEYHTVSIIEGYDSTCTSTGLTDGIKCSDCGEILGKQLVIEMKPHNTELVAGYDSTCTQIGYTDGYMCKDCGSYISGHEVIELKPHTELTVEGAAATCEEVGYTDSVVCSVCSTLLSGNEIIEATGHSFENGACTVCSQPEPSEGIEYALSDDESYYIVKGIGSCTEKDIVIASLYNGKRVKAIDYGAFYATDITSVVIPNSIVYMGDEAFKNCGMLESVVIGNGITTIPYGAFNLCEKLNNLVIPNSVKNICENAFLACVSLKEVKIPSSVESIGDYAFAQCYALEKVVIPNSVSQMGSFVFAMCPNVTVNCVSTHDRANWSLYWRDSLSSEYSLNVVWGYREEEKPTYIQGSHDYNAIVEYMESNGYTLRHPVGTEMEEAEAILNDVYDIDIKITNVFIAFPDSENEFCYIEVMFFESIGMAEQVYSAIGEDVIGDITVINYPAGDMLVMCLNIMDVEINWDNFLLEK